MVHQCCAEVSSNSQFLLSVVSEKLQGLCSSDLLERSKGLIGENEYGAMSGKRAELFERTFLRLVSSGCRILLTNHKASQAL